MEQVPTVRRNPVIADTFSHLGYMERRVLRSHAHFLTDYCFVAIVDKLY